MSDTRDNWLLEQARLVAQERAELPRWAGGTATTGPTRAEADARLTELIAKWRNASTKCEPTPVGRYVSLAVQLCAQELESTLTALYGPTPAETPTPAEAD